MRHKKKSIIPLTLFIIFIIGLLVFGGLFIIKKVNAPLIAESLPSHILYADFELPAAPEPDTDLNLNTHIVAIDAGHQAQGNSEHEPIGPGAYETKPKVAGGTSGTSTGIPEYQPTLDISLQLEQELKNRGYTVIMIRNSNEVNISNAERAVIANESGAEIFIRIHANGDNNPSTAGALTMSPSARNQYTSQISSECQRLAECVINAYCSASGFKNRGIITSDTMSGINWCTIPVTILEMGFMTNPEEDIAMQNPDTQMAMVTGIANGIDSYFGMDE